MGQLVQFEFEDHYIIYIVLVLGMLSCCRCFVDSLGSFVQNVDRCVDASCCDVRDACGVQDASVCALVLRRALLLFCFAQPLLLPAVRFAAQREHMQAHSAVWLLRVLQSAPLSPTAAPLGALAASASNATQVHVHLGVIEIDYLMLAVVFALSASVNVWFFTNWSHSLDGAALWDCEVSDSEAWFSFELSYYVQVLFMNWTLLALACREQTLLHVYYAGLALALVIWFFLAASRFKHDSMLEHYGATVAFAVLLSTLLPLWETMTTACPLSQAACAVHAVCVGALVLGHYTAFGQASAGYVTLLRFGVTVLCSVFNMVAVALDDGLCARGSVAEAKTFS